MSRKVRRIMALNNGSKRMTKAHKESPRCGEYRGHVFSKKR